MEDYLPKRHYRIEEVAKYFTISERYIHRLIDEGKLKATKIRNCLRVSIDEIKRYWETLKDVDVW
jgi:excisionase family DNA binding protein